MHNLRVATYNVQCGVGTTKNYLQYITSAWKYILPTKKPLFKTIAQRFYSQNLDILALTEIETNALRCQNQDVVACFQTYFPESFIRFFPTKKVGKLLNQGNLIVSKYPVLSHDTIKLNGGIETRYLQKIALLVNDKTIHIFLTHLSLSSRARRTQIGQIKKELRSCQTQYILLGDFNTQDKCFGDINQSFESQLATFPSWKPKKAYDKIISSHTVGSIHVEDTYKYSDHLPLFATIVLQ
jgi:endonuclease/exonuclease/phosphatase family metal-dependent hydrolase